MKGHKENYPYRLNSLPPTHINSFTEILLLRQYWEARTLEIILAEVRRVEHLLMDGIKDLLKHTKTDMAERWQGIGGRPEQDLSQINKQQATQRWLPLCHIETMARRYYYEPESWSSSNKNLTVSWSWTSKLWDINLCCLWATQPVCGAARTSSLGGYHTLQKVKVKRASSLHLPPDLSLISLGQKNSVLHTAEPVRPTTC